jgi:hypothetical protein
LVFALKKLKLCEPLKDSISDFRPTGFILVLNDRNVCVQSFKVRLLALLSVDCRVEVVANRFPWTGTVSQRIAQEIGTGEVGWATPTSEIDLLVAPSFAFANLALQCDCHIASNA